MSTTTPNMSLVLPTLNGDPGTWDNSINASLSILDGHRHVPGEGVQIPTAGIGINADLTFGGYAATNLKATRYTAQVATPGAFSVYFKGVDAYIADGNGTEVRMTASGQVNVSIAGGITGDYVSAGAAVYYDDAAKGYRFLQLAPAPNVWASVMAGDVDLYEKTSGSATRVRLSSPAALAGSYAITFPAALPGSTSIVQLSSAGVLTASNTVANAATFSSAVTFSVSPVFSTLVTFALGATMAANQHVTVSGTGLFKHGGETMNVSPLLGLPLAAAADFVPVTNAVYVLSVGAAKQLNIPIQLKAGDRITDLQYTIGGNPGGTGDFTITLNHYTAVGVRTAIGSDTKNNHAAGLVTYSLAVTDTTLSAGDVIIMEIVCSEADQQISTLAATYTRP